MEFYSHLSHHHGVFWCYRVYWLLWYIYQHLSIISIKFWLRATNFLLPSRVNNQEVCFKFFIWFVSFKWLYITLFLYFENWCLSSFHQYQCYLIVLMIFLHILGVVVSVVFVVLKLIEELTCSLYNLINLSITSI